MHLNPHRVPHCAPLTIITLNPHSAPLHPQPDPTAAGTAGARAGKEPSPAESRLWRVNNCRGWGRAGGRGPGGGGAGAPPHPRPSLLPAGAGGSRQAAGDGSRTPPRRSGARSGAEEAAAARPRGARCRPAGPWTPAALRPAARRSTRTRYRGCGGPAPVPRPGGLWGLAPSQLAGAGGVGPPLPHPSPLRWGRVGGGAGGAGRGLSRGRD